MQVVNPKTQQSAQEKSIYVSLMMVALLSAATSLPPTLAWAASQSPPLSMATATLSPEEAGILPSSFADLPAQTTTLATAQFTPKPKPSNLSVAVNTKQLSMATATLTPEEVGKQPLLYTARNTSPSAEAEKKFLSSDATVPKDTPVIQLAAANSSTMPAMEESQSNAILTENAAAPPITVDGSSIDSKKISFTQPMAANSVTLPTEAGTHNLSAKRIAPIKQEPQKRNKHTLAPPPSDLNRPRQVPQ